MKSASLSRTSQAPTRSQAVYDSAFAAGLLPDIALTVSEWADANRVLSMRASSEPGPWRTSRAPYLREPMDLLSSTNLTQKVVVMKGSQLGFTENGNNWIGYVIDHAPGPMLAVQPTVETAKRNSKQRIDPLIEDCASLRDKVKPSRSRDSGNTVLSKDFRGGVLVMTGANSAVGLRSMPVRYLFLDEIDAYPWDVDEEGDPVDLAIVRTRTFSRRKIYLVSTPTIAGRSRIEMEFAASDRRRYWVPCPLCGEFQVLKFAQLRWPEGRPREARYVCEHCNGSLGDEHKTAMLAAGAWRPEIPGQGRPAGFHISSLYSPVGWLSWVEIAEAWVAAQGNQEDLKTFINTVLGETWKEQGEAPDWQRLYDRAEDWKIGEAPAGVVFLTLGVDIQANRIEVAVWGWGPGLESWLVDHRVLEGDPYAKEVWSALDALVAETWRHAGGTNLAPMGVGIDSGYATTEVYKWTRRQRPGLAMAIKGVEQGAAAVGIPKAVDVASEPGKKKKRRGGTVWPVVGGIYKSELYGFLRLEAPTRESGDPFPQGYVHMPKFSDEVFKQLTSEQLASKIVKFRRKIAWEKTRERNEQLDLRVYARAAAARFGIDRFQARHWKRLAVHVAASIPKPRPADDDQEQASIAAFKTTMADRPAPDPAPAAGTNEGPKRPRRPGGWLRRDGRGPWLKR